MSAASFDDSSNLVDLGVSENNGDQESAGLAEEKKQPDLLDEIFDSHEEKELEVTSSKPKSRKSKAKKLLKRAKSPISGAINKTTKEFKKLSNLPKHHYSTPKSPSKSPSNENLTDEYSHLEEKLSEKKSDEWLAFQQMQERIKQTVLKTQNSLNKYHSQSDEDEPKSGKAGWTDFDADTALEPEELIDTSLAPVISISCDNTGSELNDQQDLINVSLDKPLIEPSTHTSSPLCPEPVNSIITGMDNLIDDPPMEATQETTAQGEADLLGFLGDPAPVETSKTNTSSDLLAQDLLGLDSFLEPVPAASSKTEATSQPDGAQVLSGYSFSSPLTADPVTNTQESKQIVTEDLLFNSSDATEMVADNPTQNAAIDLIGDSGSQNVAVDLMESSGNQNVAIDLIGRSTNSTTDHIGGTVTQNVAVDLIGGNESQSGTIDLFSSNGAQNAEVDLIGGSGNQNVAVGLIGETFDALDSTPAKQEITVEEPKQTNPLLAMLGDPLEPVAPIPASSVTALKPEPTEIEVKITNTSAPDDFSSFDPMKVDAFNISSSAATSFNPFNPASSPLPVASGGQGVEVSSVNMFGTSPQSYGAMPAASGSMDLMSKIKSMSKTQPVSPARRMAPKPPKDHFGFVKKELKKPPGEVVVLEDEEDDEGYKTLADLGKPKVEDTILTEEVIKPEEGVLGVGDIGSEADMTSAANNPFLTGNFNNTALTASQNITMDAAAVFGLDDGLIAKPAESTDFDFNSAWETDVGDSKRQQWTDVDALDSSSNLFDASEFEKPAEGSAFGDDLAWDSKATDAAPAWGAESEASTENSNPFQQDDFSKFDDVPEGKVASASANPFLATDLIADSSTAGTSTVNPFLDFGESQTNTGEQSANLLDSKPMVLSDSENFFMDSVAENKTDANVTDDLFDPFKVTAKASEAAAEDPLDLFSSAAAAGDKQLAKPSDDDDHVFKLEIKPLNLNRKGAASPTPLLKPPPKPPKSPQPRRENPFDRESPPEENFAQFEIKDVDKPKEPPPKSLSTESTTTEEEEIVEPLSPFLPKSDLEGFKLMLRYPTKKKIAGNRYWKNVFVKLVKQGDGPAIKVFNHAKDALPLQELPLQPCYSLSDVALQQYDQYGKIHTVKLQYVFYKERVGIKTERITPSIVKFKKREKPKATMILDHSPQVSELLKFGSLDKEEIILFIREVENTFMNLEAHREKTLTYAKDEVTAEVHDEYLAELNKFGKVLTQKGRVRIFVLAFLTGMPVVEVGLNDKRRRGKEVVGRCDIIPIKTEEWIRLEDVEFHCSVDKDEFEKTNNIKFRPLDACQFELLRYRVRLRENKELPLQLTIQQIFKNRKCEIRCDLLVTGYHSYSKKHGQFPCEDIEVRFPIPEHWIYMFRYERRFGYGSIHSSTRKPGKIKGLERLTMMAQGHFNQTLMEADVGTAKYEHVYRSVVWRIPRLPVRNQGAYTSHLFKLRLELGPHDEIPDSFENFSHVEFTMPCSTVSQSQIRSIAVTNPNPPEKWVRSMAHYQYRIEIEHLDEYPEMMAIGTVYKEATMVSPTKSEEENNEPEERDPRLAVSDTDSSDSD